MIEFPTSSFLLSFRFFSFFPVLTCTSLFFLKKLPTYIDNYNMFSFYKLFLALLLIQNKISAAPVSSFIISDPDYFEHVNGKGIDDNIILKVEEYPEHIFKPIKTLHDDSEYLSSKTYEEIHEYHHTAIKEIHH